MKKENTSTFVYSRRSFLKHLSIAPLAFSPLVLAGRAEGAPLVKPRLLLISVAHGPGGYGMATGTETNFTLSPWLAPLDGLKKHLTLVDGLLGTFWGNAHDVSYSHLFTSSVKPGTASFTTPRSASLDVLLEEKLGKGILSVQRLGVNPWGRGTGSTAKAICYDRRFRALPTQNDPELAFQAIVNNITGTSNPQTTLSPQALKRRLLLDEAVEDIKSLRARIGGKERDKLDSHLDAINNARANLGLNKKIQVGGQCQKPSPIKRGQFEDNLRLQLANIKTAFTCGLTDIAVLDVAQIPHDLYTWKDSNGKMQKGKPCSDKDFHQCVAHYGKDPNQRLCFEGSVAWFMERFATFAKELDAIPEANGKSMLENTIIVITGEVGDGSHETLRKPHVIIGGSGAPRLRTGRHIKVPVYKDDKVRTTEGDHTVYSKKDISTRTEADLWREISIAMGAPMTTFGSPYLNKGKIGLL